jgi:hypothetical protein
MSGNVEWIGKTSGQRETATVTLCASENGRLNIVFSNSALWSEGRIALNDQAGEQQTKGMYRFTDGSYEGIAEVVGTRTSDSGVIQFSGTWFDKNDGTGEEWEVIIEIYDVQQYTFTYDDPQA